MRVSRPLTHLRCAAPIQPHFIHHAHTRRFVVEGFVGRLSERSQCELGLWFSRCVCGGRRSYVLSFVFIFDKESDKYAFAYSYPFTYTHQQRLLAHIEWRNLPYVQRFLVCRSVQHRRVDALLFAPPRGGEASALGPKAKGGGRQKGSGASTAGAARGRAAAGAAKQRRRVVVVCARVHPGETPASFCVTGLINYLLSTKPEVVRGSDSIADDPTTKPRPRLVPRLDRVHGA
jgi:hypothetical protein